MNILEYQKECVRTCPDLHRPEFDQMHMAIGASTEANELLDVYKKWFAYNKPLDVINIGEEIGDIFWYVVNLCRMLKLNPEEIMDKNIKKLKQRYPEKFTEENAINRNLEKEREILES